MKDARAALGELLGPDAVGSIELSSRAPLPLACPSSEEEVVEVIHLARRRGWRILPVGLGSKLSWSAPSGSVDCALSTRRLAGVVAYEPGDGTLSARAGSSMAELERVAGEGGNHLTPRVAAPARATLGGVLAAGQSGIDRLRHGPSRHHVLGMRVALADGSVARSGGRLVKNVTGYDLHRLYCGSRGSLCVVLEASLRLFAAAERELLLTIPARDRASAIDSARRAAELGVQPLGIRAENVLSPEGAWRVHVLLAGRDAVVGWGRREILAALPEGVEGAETVERLRDAELAPGRWPDLRASGRPSRLAAALERLPGDTRMIVEPSLALASVFVDAAGVDAASRALAESGLAVHRVAAADAFETWNPIAARLKLGLDPGLVFAGGPTLART